MRLERRLGGRIGVEALRGGARLSHRAGARFAYCSTFKWLLAAAVLEAADAGRLRLDEAVAVRKEDLLPHSPVTEARVGKAPMTLAELCEATVTTSDNAAANLLEARIGGLAGMRAFAARLGDTTTRFDRLEPALNENRAGDPRDTTTPAAMARDLRRVLEADVLKPASRERLLDWMKACATGGARIRAGVPAGWTVADKTGTGSRGAAGDVGALWPPAGPPVYLAIYVDLPKAEPAEREAAIAEATRLALRELGLLP